MTVKVGKFEVEVRLRKGGCTCHNKRTAQALIEAVSVTFQVIAQNLLKE